MGCGVRLRHSAHLFVGRNCILEEHVEIAGLAGKGIRFDDNVAIGRGTLIKPTSYYGRNVGEGMIIGENSSIGPDGYVGCSGFISIGANVLIGPRVSMHGENHEFADRDNPIKAQGVRRDGISIGDDCWIGSDTVLLGGVHIGRGSVIGAGSVVTKSLPPDTVAIGVPARVIHHRQEFRTGKHRPRRWDATVSYGREQRGRDILRLLRQGAVKGAGHAAVGARGPSPGCGGTVPWRSRPASSHAVTTPPTAPLT